MTRMTPLMMATDQSSAEVTASETKEEEKPIRTNPDKLEFRRLKYFFGRITI